jgi:hypothetical protein
VITQIYVFGFSFLKVASLRIHGAHPWRVSTHRFGKEYNNNQPGSASAKRQTRLPLQQTLPRQRA